MTTCSIPRLGRCLLSFALVLCGCYSIERLTLPEAGPGHHVTLLGIGDEGALLVDSSTSSGTAVYGPSSDESVSEWYPSGERVFAIQFSATALVDEFSKSVAPDEVRIARTSTCIDTCSGTKGNFRVKKRTACSKYWEGSPTRNSAFQFYDWVEGEWTPRLGETVTAGVDVDDIRCAFTLELAPN